MLEIGQKSKKRKGFGWCGLFLPACLLMFLAGYGFWQYGQGKRIFTTKPTETVESAASLETLETVGVQEEGAARVQQNSSGEVAEEASRIDAAFVFMRPHEQARLPRVDYADPAMGTENGDFVYNAQPFLSSQHLGDDLNGIGGWNSDLGDPVYAVANGRVTYRGTPSAPWGKMVILSHMVDGQVYQSVYAHLQSIEVQSGQSVHRGQKIATVGGAEGRYLAHLHLEIRQSEVIDPSFGYAESSLGRLSPLTWIKRKRFSVLNSAQGNVVRLPAASALREVSPELYFEVD